MIDPEAARRLRAEAELAHREGRHAQARQALQALADAGAETPDLLLLRAFAVAQLDGAEAALPLLDAAVLALPDDARARLRRARARLSAKDPVGALADAEATLGLTPSSVDAHLAAFEAATRLGRFPEAVRHLLAAVQLRPDDADLRLRAARTLLGHRDLQAAREQLEAAVRLRPQDAEAWFALVDAALELGDREAARAALQEAGALAPARWRRRAARHVALGELDAVPDLLPAGADGDAFRATLALWRTDVDEADHLATAVLHDAPEHAEALCVRGACAIQRGEPRAGIPLLDQARRALTRQPDPDGWLTDDTLASWLAAGWLAAGDRARAQAWSQLALTEAWTWNVTAALQRTLARVSPSEDPTKPLVPEAWARLADRVRPLIPSPERLEGSTLVGVRAALADTLLRFGGNRSPWPTLVEGGRLVPWTSPPWPRHEARLTEHLLRTRPVDDVVAAYRALQARFPEEPTPHTYLGETLLWVGRYAASEPEFHAAIAREEATTWAWIGLGAAATLQGRPEEGLDWFRRGVEVCDYEGPTIFLYRAEALRALGQHEAARLDLDQALVAKPQRLSAWVLRALVDADAGDARAAVAVLAQIRERAPGLWADLLALPQVDADHPDDAPAVLRGLLGLMRGNRSSTLVTTFAVDGAGPRFTLWGRWYDPGTLFSTVRSRQEAARSKLSPRPGPSSPANRRKLTADS